jgi:two-component system OmpR family response regulator
MTQLLPLPQRCVDFVRVKGSAPTPTIEPAAARARVVLRPYPIDYPEAAVGIRFTGDVVMVEVPVIDSSALLMLAEIRKRISVRLVLIAAEAPAEQRILARTLGTDHVLEAPVDERELAAVLRNALRSGRAIQTSPRENELHHHWRLEMERWVLIAPNQREVRLTRSEYVVLGLLLDRAGVIQSRATLLEGMNGCPQRERVLDVLLSKLRRKVRDCTTMELPLRSARNAGYVFAGNMGHVSAPTALATAAMQH